MVARPELWPGAKFLPEDLGTTITVKKPEGAFFGGRGREKQVPTDPYALEHWLSELAREQDQAVEFGRERDRERRRDGKRPSTRRSRELDRQPAPQPRPQPAEGPPRVLRAKSFDPLRRGQIEISLPDGYEGWSPERVLHAQPWDGFTR